jgi:transposase, IS30 family
VYSSSVDLEAGVGGGGHDAGTGPWQRGSNENTNRLLRFWFEKGTDLSAYTKTELKRIQDKLNSRPKPTLNLDTPAQRLTALISQAA